MNIYRTTYLIIGLALSSVFAVGSHANPTDISTVPLTTISMPSSTDVKPNVLFVLDDSGSMDSTYLPDWAGGNFLDYLKKNQSFNGVAYSPAVRYLPPKYYTSAGVLDATTYPSQTGTSAATGRSGTTGQNWQNVKNDAYGTRTNGSSNLEGQAYFFVSVPKEYCDSLKLNNCTAASSPTGNYTYPAPLRWCSSNTLSTCQTNWISGSYTNERHPTPNTATITVTGTANITSVTVDGAQILSGTASGNSTANLATSIATNINACTTSKPGTSNCTVLGYSASVGGNNNNVITITGIDGSTSNPVVTPGSGVTVTAFAKTVIPGSTVVGTGDILRVTIAPSITSYPYPGSNVKHPNRTDCAGTTCTYAEEMTNYANWWSYYQTRLQMMKTSSSNAFSAMDSATDIANGISRFRVGFMTINDNTRSDFLNLGEFKTTQKKNWYDKLFNANAGNSTPLRIALAKAGQLYGGVLNGTQLNGSTVVDPLQYSCQQNYTILSTDGYWNENSNPTKLDKTTAVGNQDGAMPRPYNDGATAILQTKTSTLQTRTITNLFQSKTSTLQTRVTPLQQRTRATSTSAWSAWANAAQCVPGTNTQCRYSTTTNNTATTGSFVTATATCTVNDNTGSTGTWIGDKTECQYTTWPNNWTSVNSCTAVSQSTGSPYSVLVARQCQANPNPTTGPWVTATSCTVTASTGCQYTAWSTNWTTVGSCTAVPQSTAPTYTVATARQCQTASSGGTSNTLADVAAYYYNTDLRNPNANLGADTTGTCTGPIIAPATTANDLCANNVPSNGRDTATNQHMTTFTLGLGAPGQMVYSPTYWTDVSGDFWDVWKGTTANSSAGICSWQNTGACNWPTPAADSSANIDDLWHAAVNGRGDYFSATDPASLSTSLSRALTTISNTPRPGAAAAAASSNPNVSQNDNFVFSSSYKSVEWYGEVVRQRIDTLTGVLSPQNWSAKVLLDCAMTTWAANNAYIAGAVYRQGTSCYVVNTDYTSGASFDGSATGVDGVNITLVLADQADPTSGAVTAPTSRTIYTRGASGLIPFAWNSLSTAQQAYFTTPAISSLSQFCAVGTTCLSSAAQVDASGQKLVNFLAGDRTYGGTYYRKRTHILGDIVSSEARYVAAPLFNYTDANYGTFKTAQASRAGTVYVAANDGMLHAFDGASGKESWAYIPSMVLPNLYMLADANYSYPNMHQYFVDGSPETGDICPVAPASTCTSGTGTSSDWKTILVGGLNRGGMGFYALDVTDPANPHFLWEFTDPNLGYSYSNPRITKLKDGTWVVLVASGYNNADGIGRLFVLKASDGTLIRTISNGFGSATSPSGVARISAYATDALTSNTTLAVYGGDLYGNLWRFDVNGDIGATGYDAQKLIQFVDANGNAQSVTAKPLEATINGMPVIYVGTGRYLGTTDVTDTSFQSFYAVQDNLGATTYGNPRTAATGFVQQTLTNGSCPTGAPTNICTPGQVVRTSSSNAVNWATQHGWYMDFLTGGERSYTDPVLGLGTLMFTTITPAASSVNACGGSDLPASFAYMLDYLTGGAVVGSLNVVAGSLGTGLVTRPILIEEPDGSIRALIRTSSGSGSGTDLGGTIVLTPPVLPPSSSGTRRVSWRELPTR